ncbi:unnamed protein product, partial [Didymodactylos carnosus]
MTPPLSFAIVDGETIYLERIKYIQCDNRRCFSVNKTSHPSNSKSIEIYFDSEIPRTDYLYKVLSFEANIKGFDTWLKALNCAIAEAKNITIISKQNRWLYREYEKLRKSMGLTIDSINGWLNSHLGIVGEKKLVEMQIKNIGGSIDTNEISF